MSFTRRAFGSPPNRFGRRQPFVLAMPDAEQGGRARLLDDLKLFGLTYFAGLLFMTIYLA